MIPGCVGASAVSWASVLDGGIITDVAVTVDAVTVGKVALPDADTEDKTTLEEFCHSCRFPV